MIDLSNSVRPYVLKLLVVLGLVSFSGSPIFSQSKPGEFDAELYAQLVRQSNVQFTNLIKSKTVLADHKGWKKPIDKAFGKLSKNSGNPPFL